MITLSDTIDGFLGPIVNDYLVPVIFWDPIRFLGFDIGTDIPIVVVWLNIQYFKLYFKNEIY